jgi:type IV secretory pathway VirB6-like protein
MGAAFDWYHPFSWLWAQVGGPLDVMVNAAALALLQWITPGYKGAAILFMSFISVYVIMFQMGDPILNWLSHLVRIALVATILSMVFFQPFINNVFLHTVPEGIIGAIGKASGLAIPRGSASQAFDVAVIDMMASGAKIAAKETGWSAQAIGIVVLSYAYRGLGAVAIIATYAVWFVTQFTLHLVVATAPIGMVCLAFPKTRQIFDAWLSVMAGLGLLQGLVWLALTVVMGIEASIVHAMLTYPPDAGDRAGVEALQMILAGAIYLLFAWQLKGLPVLAMQLIGGAHSAISGIVGGIMSSPAAVAGVTARGVQAARSGGGGSHAAGRPILPAARFLGSSSRIHP